MRRRLLALPFAAALAGCGADPDPAPAGGIQQGTRIDIDTGPVAGTTIGPARAFLGIPYAEPPVGEKRWRSPVAAEPWSEAIDASAAGPECPQLDLLSGTIVEDASEDCLTLNVWSPDPAPSTPLPVMVWLHGGGFIAGSGHQDGAYAGDRLSERGVVLVTLNYRLGPLGFLAHEELTAEAGAATGGARTTSGNYGIEDQRLALEWVQRNVLAFGGDPGNVTLFGESAGAMSVAVHLASPESTGLFRRALCESGIYNALVDPLSSAEGDGASFALAAGCDGGEPIGCLRDKTPTELLEASPPAEALLFGDNETWLPNIDGVVLPEPPLERFAAGNAAPGEILIGSNADEGQLFVFLDGSTDMTAEEYEAVVRDGPLTAAQADQVLAEYPASAFETPADALAAVITASLFTCPTRTAARALAGGGQSVHLYHFVHAPASLGLGAFHAAELSYVFGHAPFGLPEPTEADEPLIALVQGYWTRFAANGDPNGADAIAWPRYETASAEHLVIDVPATSDADLAADTCDFWDALLSE